MTTVSLINKIGNTPLIYLKKASEISGCKIFGKAEFLNPGESVKDRAALYILNDAIKNGKLKKGGTIVEGTAGNTGIGIAIIAKELGIKTVIVIPETQSKEKKDTLRELGAELIEVPAVPYDNPNNYVKYAKKVADDIDNATLTPDQRATAKKNYYELIATSGFPLKPDGTRRLRGICLGGVRRRPRATTPCRCACPPIAHGPPQNFVLFSQDNVTL